MTFAPIFGALAQLGERMAGSHEVRGSIPLGSTTCSIASLETSLRFLICGAGLNPAKVQQPSGLLNEEGEARRTKTCAQRMDSRSPRLCHRNIRRTPLGFVFFVLDSGFANNMKTGRHRQAQKQNVLCLIIGDAYRKRRS